MPKVSAAKSTRAKDNLLPSDATQKQAFDRVIGVARKLPAAEVQPLGTDADWAYTNARDGYAVVEPRLAEVRDLGKHGHTDAQAIVRVPEVAAALLYGSRRLELVVPKIKTRPIRVKRARQLRAALLLEAQVAVTLGLIPAEPVGRIAKGHGVIDSVNDLVALVELYRQYRDVLGRGLVTPELIDEAEHLGAGLRAELRPQDAPKQVAQKDAELAALTDDRNRLWTLLVRDYGELTRVAHFLGLTIPTLQSRRAPAAAKATKKKPADDEPGTPPDATEG